MDGRWKRRPLAFSQLGNSTTLSRVQTCWLRVSSCQITRMRAEVAAIKHGETCGFRTKVKSSRTVKLGYQDWIERGLDTSMARNSQGRLWGYPGSTPNRFWLDSGSILCRTWVELQQNFGSLSALKRVSDDIQLARPIPKGTPWGDPPGGPPSRDSLDVHTRPRPPHTHMPTLDFPPGASRVGEGVRSDLDMGASGNPHPPSPKRDPNGGSPWGYPRGTHWEDPPGRILQGDPMSHDSLLTSTRPPPHAHPGLPSWGVWGRRGSAFGSQHEGVRRHEGM